MSKEYTLFWSGFLSNWHISPFRLDGMDFTCVEQYMMYKKAMLFKDQESADEIMRITNPRTIKRIGRSVKNFDPKIWNALKFEIVFNGCLAKFSQNEHLKKKLLATEGKSLKQVPMT